MKKIIGKVCLLLSIIALLVTAYHIFDVHSKILMLFYPIRYAEYIYPYSEKLEIDPMLTFAIIKTESNFDENAESKSGAIGLMQLMKNTAQQQAQKLNISYTEDMLYEPDMNLQLGLTYFDTLLDYYQQNYILAFTAYNAGLGNVQKWIKDGTIQSNGTDIENIPFKETNLYVRKVIKTYEIYQKLYKQK